MSEEQEKNQKKENEKNKIEEPLVNLLYSFKKNITSQDPFYPLNNLVTKIIYMDGKVVVFVPILKK